MPDVLLHFTFRVGKKEEAPSCLQGEWLGQEPSQLDGADVGCVGSVGGILAPPSPPAIQAGEKTGEKNVLRDFQSAVTMETPSPASQGCSWYGAATEPWESTGGGNGAREAEKGSPWPSEQDRVSVPWGVAN